MKDKNFEFVVLLIHYKISNSHHMPAHTAILFCNWIFLFELVEIVVK